ncbi:DUF3180 domain-containing protein [Amycolatopsis anabasis]|uniref:DUF3180 domain-containing protein n=1 Tax=Amycolatopsis anabasis TaxID=1840409 RepID=UPI00131E4A68|nr:DUF3180 domain-containing protein [Amycolatopsis anabasis]
MHFTRPRDLFLAGLIGLALAYLLFELAYGSIPQLPIAAGVTLFVLGLIECVLAFVIRGRIRAGRVPAVIVVARSVALAKASSLLGALMTGAWVGILIYLLPRQSRLPAAASDLRSAVVGVGCAIVLVAAALWLEHCCRTPEPGDRDRANPPTG